MTCRIKPLRLALMAALALSGVAAAGASAAEFHSEVEPTIITGSNAGEGNVVLKASGAEVVCTGINLKGSATPKTATTLTLFPTLSGCAFLEEAAAVDTTGCAYLVTSHTNASGHVPVSIECTAGSTIKVTTSACTLQIGAQTGTGGAMATNIGSGGKREVTADLTGTTTFSKSGPLCFLIAGNSASYTGRVRLTGYENLGVSGPIDQPSTTYTEGKQVGVWWE